AEALPYLDYFLPNAEEAAMLTGLEDPDEMADCLLQYGVKNVTIKLGKKGCFIKNGQERYHIPAFPAEAVDTTGAGDNFAAGFITAVLDGMELEACGIFANAAAAASTESVGAVGGVRDRLQIEIMSGQKERNTIAYQPLKRE
ncbi:MAG: PfkB family carbohydrate kinase, partial [Eubacteriales bacterium]|nr:PfkB family carbohydrate kinase [Eubacteriales bacterium]